MTAPTVPGAGADNHGTTGAVTYTLPAHQADDILLLVCETNVTGGLTAPSGWAHVTNSPKAQGSNVTSLSVFWLRAASSSETDPQVPAAADHQVGFAFNARGVINSGNPWDFTPVASGNASGSAMSATGGTTTVADTLVIVCSGNATDTASDNYTSVANGTLAGFSVLNQSFTTDGNGGGVMVATGTLAAAGATGTTTATITTAGATANIVLALVPAPPTTAYPFELLTPTPRYY